MLMRVNRLSMVALRMHLHVCERDDRWGRQTIMRSIISCGTVSSDDEAIPWAGCTIMPMECSYKVQKVEVVGIGAASRKLGKKLGWKEVRLV
jgi:hypothetical protein